MRVVAADAPDPDVARRQAAQILSDDRFRPRDVPRPFEGVVEWIGDRIEAVADALAGVVGSVSGAVPGGGTAVMVALAAAVLVLSAVVAARLGVRRARATLHDGAATPARAEDAAALERAAAAAERRGDFDAAVRLRFRAGLVRVAAAGGLEWRPSLTSAGVARAIRSPAFDELAAAFDAVAYGGRRADARDVELARARWARVLEEIAPA